MKKFSYSLVYTSLFLTSTYALAETTATLGEVIVSGTPFSQQVGSQKLNEEQIKRRPTKDGNITELLRSNPNVQFSNTSDTSTSGGEIAPNEVSIHGEAFYNNNYTIDGLSNNDNLNPASDNSLKAGKDVDGYSPTDLPGGGTQSFWIDTSLLKNVEAFDSNISAKYGNFTGGVINAELKDPDLAKSSGKVFYRITRDDWASFKVDNKEEFEQASTLGTQPQFTKQQYGIVLNQPLSDKAAILFQYNRSESKIPYNDVGLGWVNQRRTNETYLLRGTYLPDNGDLWKATVMYSPHESKYFKKGIRNGAFTNTGGGVQVNLEWDKTFDWGKMESTLGYKKSGNTVEHESNDYNFYAITNSINWCSSYSSTTGRCLSASEGGYGKFKTEKQTWTFKQDYNLNAFDTGSVEHKIGFGWEIDLARAKYERDQLATTTSYKKASSTTGCTSECITNEQYAFTKTFYPARNVKVSDNTYAAYLEDSVTWKRLNAVLGVRLDHDEYLNNTNIAPRFSTSYDVFGDQSTRLFGGINRYYSGTMISYKLRNSIGVNQVYNRASPTANWILRNDRNTNYDVSNLKTPYSDEYSLGLSQKIANTQWTLKWVNRHGKNQFTQVSETINGVKNYFMTNDGKNKTNTYTLTINPTEKYKLGFAEFDWAVGAQISKTEKNYTTYDASALDDGYEKMLLNGQLKDITEGIPATDYNTPWSSFVELNTYFPSIRLDWNQRFSYNSGYRYWKTDSLSSCNVAACGSYTGKVKTYDEEKQGSYFNLDWRFAYKQPIVREQYLELTLDINNVLNRKILTQTVSSSSSTTQTYKMGRNFWLGASYNW